MTSKPNKDTVCNMARESFISFAVFSIDRFMEYQTNNDIKKYLLPKATSLSDEDRDRFVTKFSSIHIANFFLVQLLRAMLHDDVSFLFSSLKSVFWYSSELSFKRLTSLELTSRTRASSSFNVQRVCAGWGSDREEMHKALFRGTC